MTGKWTCTAGPRQVKPFEKALQALSWEGRTTDEINGVVGGKESGHSYVNLFGPVRAEVQLLIFEFGEKHGWTVTRENVKELTAEAEARLAVARESRPVVDNRRTPEEDAELTAARDARRAEYAAQRAAEEEILARVMAKAPAGAVGLIVAELHEDTSDVMTDYFSNKTTRTVAIGFRFSKREDFRALHRAAALFPETAHLGSQEAFEAWLGEDAPEYLAKDGTERRDNYSMGKGNYLSDHGWDGAGSGWVVKSRLFPCTWVHLTEETITTGGTVAEEVTVGGSIAAEGVTVRAGRDGKTEVAFDAIPAPEVRKGLKDHGFRWNGADKCWYGRDRAYAESLAGGGEQ